MGRVRMGGRHGERGDQMVGINKKIKGKQKHCIEEKRENEKC